MVYTVDMIYAGYLVYAVNMVTLKTLFAPAFFSISKDWMGGGRIAPPLLVLELGGDRVPNILGNDLTMNDWPYSK